jgi:hypothetical protein
MVTGVAGVSALTFERLATLVAFTVCLAVTML